MSEPRKNDWLSPQNLLAAAGMGGMIMTSFQSFRDDARDRLARVEYRVAELDKEADSASLHDDARTKFETETNLRLDRLERGK